MHVLAAKMQGCGLDHDDDQSRKIFVLQQCFKWLDKEVAVLALKKITEGSSGT